MDSFVWLIELRPAFPHHPAFQATYYAGYMARPIEAAQTFDPYSAPRFATEAAAQAVVDKLPGTLSCVWEAVEHGFHDAPPPQRGLGK